MNKKKLFALGMISCFLLSGCGQAGDTTQEETLPEAQVQEESGIEENGIEETDTDNQQVTITYETENNIVTAEDGREIYRYEYSYPVVTIVGNEQAVQEIAKDQEKRKNEFMESSKEHEEAAKAAYAQIVEEEEQEDFQCYDDYLSFELERNDSRVISFRVISYTEGFWSYLGGTQGDSYFGGANYDANTGKLLTLDDIFEDKEAGLEGMKSYVLKQCEAAYYQERLFEDYEEYIDTIFTEDYWYLGREGIHIISNAYMLGSYAAGNFEFIVPYTELSGLKEEYKSENAYIYPVLNGSSMETDLDSDGTLEDICYNVEQTSSMQVDENGEEYEVYDVPKCTLTINGQDMTEQFMELTQYNPESSSEYYYVVDLDEKDEYKELAICDYGFNDYNVTYFLRYHKGELKYLGYINAMVADDMCELKGDGTLKARIHSELLETANLEGNYYVSDGELVLAEQDWYEYNRTYWSEEYTMHNILKDVTVYTKNDLSSEKKILTSEDGPVTFPATDNKNWVQVETTGGETYYLYMESFLGINNDGVIEESMDIFENLLIAG